MKMVTKFLYFIALLWCSVFRFHLVACGEHRNEFIFILSRGELTCFSEEFGAISSNYTFEYKVLEGKSAQVYVVDPQPVYLYSQKEGEGQVFTFLTRKGLFSFCFANQQLVNLRQKRIYLRLEPTFKAKHYDPDTSNLEFDNAGPAGLAESIGEDISKVLARIRTQQQDYRMSREAGRGFALYLRSKVGYVAAFSTLGFLVVSLGQTLVLRKLFTPKYRSLESRRVAAD